MPTEDFNALLQKSDPDRRMAALFAPAEIRERLFTLYAFNQDIARIAEATSESLIGEMKLTWWRDAVEDLYADTPKVRRHDVTEGLATLTGIVPKDDLLDMIAARFDDVTARPFTDLGDLIAYVDRTSVTLMRLALAVSDAQADDALSRSAGRAWGLTGLLRAFPHRAQIGRAPLAGDTLSEAGGSAAMLAQGLGENLIKPALEDVRAVIHAELATLAEQGELPAETVPALGYVRLVPGYLKRLPENPFQTAAEPPLLARQLRLSWLSLTGR
ncbi:squalene/phytoene synthase family protein [Maricaulis sp.]|uniref:squalene/phytoene synthase family protein n=1 Tax=Maricaulis sp. TaxID=1486257 RepID=UPI002625379C|nr:squalene/phytoene synthase family protein [Maricaulis sp.]